MSETTPRIDERRLALIGFGEAGSILGRELVASGRFDVTAYDILVDDAEARDAMLAAGRERGVTMVRSLAAALAGAATVISAVTATASATVARDSGALLGPGQIFVDINSVSPGTKRSSAHDAERGGAAYVDAAVMAPVPPYGIGVPILLGGRTAAALAARLAPAGMKLEVVAAEVGIASAIKMCRSVMVKGLEALTLECLLAARGHGVEQRVLDSLEETFPAMRWAARADYLISRIVVHGRRRAAEMREVAVTLQEAGLAPRLALATSETEDWVADLVQKGVVARVQGDDFDWREMADAIAADDRQRRSAAQGDG